METDGIDPKISEMLKVLGALGKTLAIVPIEEALGELTAPSGAALESGK